MDVGRTYRFNTIHVQRTIVFFFFQAEDGIRDADVTGVQTCALPISKFVPLGNTVHAACGFTDRLTAQPCVPPTVVGHAASTAVDGYQSTIGDDLIGTTLGTFHNRAQTATTAIAELSSWHCPVQDVFP